MITYFLRFKTDPVVFELGNIKLIQSIPNIVWFYEAHDVFVTWKTSVQDLKKHIF